jgi:hypothetical protein
MSKSCGLIVFSRESSSRPRSPAVAARGPPTIEIAAAIAELTAFPVESDERRQDPRGDHDLVLLGDRDVPHSVDVRLARSTNPVFELALPATAAGTATADPRRIPNRSAPATADRPRGRFRPLPQHRIARTASPSGVRSDAGGRTVGRSSECGRRTGMSERASNPGGRVPLTSPRPGSDVRRPGASFDCVPVTHAWYRGAAAEGAYGSIWMPLLAKPTDTL